MRKRFCEINLLPVKDRNASFVYLLCDRTNNLLGEFHICARIGICFIILNCREFRIVGRVYPLVAEKTSNLIHLRKSSHKQFFQKSSGAMRRYKSRSSALWCVMNGFAAAPPAWLCKIGVSTSTYPASSSTARSAETTRERVRNRSFDSGEAIVSK